MSRTRQLRACNSRWTSSRVAPKMAIRNLWPNSQTCAQPVCPKTRDRRRAGRSPTIPSAKRHRQSLKQSAPAYVAHMRVRRESELQPLGQSSTLSFHFVEQTIAHDHLLHSQRRCRTHGMREIGVAMLERTQPLTNSFDNFLVDQYGADGLVAATQPLGDGHQIWRHAFLFACVKCAGAAHAAHHFIEDQ